MKIYSYYFKELDFTLIDGVVFLSLYSKREAENFDFKEIKELVSKLHSLNKQAFLDVTSVIEEKELAEFKDFIWKTKDLGIDKYLFEDYSVLNLVIRDKLIYASQTLTASSYEVSFYNDLGIETLVSSELSEKELEAIDFHSNYYKAYGPLLVFYSKRKMFTLYNKKYQKSVKDFVPYALKEAKREKESLVGYEGRNNFLIYTKNKYFGLEAIKKRNIDKIIVDSFLGKPERITELLKAIRNSLDVQIKEDEKFFFLKDELVILEDKND